MSRCSQTAVDLYVVYDLYFGLTRLFFGRFCDLVNSIAEEAWKGPEEGDCDSDALEVRGLKAMIIFV